MSKILQNITDDEFEEIIKKSLNWNDALFNCGLKTRTRTFERRVQKIKEENKSHLPTFYGGLYSKITKYTNEYYKELIEKNNSWDDVLETLKYNHIQILGNIKKHLDNIGIDYNHLTYPTRLKVSNKYKLNDILIEDSPHNGSMSRIKMRLINELGWKHECSGCHKSTYTNGWVTDVPINLEVDHINGIHSDNRLENLRFLCPNCHSYTDTYKGKNMRTTVENNKNKPIVPITVTPKELKSKKEEPKCIDCNVKVSRKGNRCPKCNDNNKFIIASKDRPSLEQLKTDLQENGNNYCAVARIYKVSDNCIRKWIKKYELINT